MTAPNGQPRRQSYQKSNKRPKTRIHPEIIIIRVVQLKFSPLRSKERIAERHKIRGCIELFDGESIYDFDQWTRRFKDYLEAAGRNWNDTEKVALLKLALGDTTRKLFGKLTDVETITVDAALIALRTKLDTPQRKESSRYKLSLCQQQENESIGAFMKRLIPLVKMTNSGLNEDEIEGKICEELRTRLKPSLANLMRLLGTSRLTKLDEFMERAEEVEAAMNSGQCINSSLHQAINMLESQTPFENRTGHNGNEDLGPSFRNILGRDTMESDSIEYSMYGQNQDRIWDNEQELMKILPNGDNPLMNRQSGSIHFTATTNRMRTADGRIWAPLDDVIRTLQNLSTTSNANTTRGELNSILTISDEANKFKFIKPNEELRTAEKPKISNIIKISNWEGICPGTTRFMLGMLTLMSLMNVIFAKSCPSPNQLSVSPLRLKHSSSIIPKYEEICLFNNGQHLLEDLSCQNLKRVIQNSTNEAKMTIEVDSKSLGIWLIGCEQVFERQNCYKNATKSRKSGLRNIDNKIDFWERIQEIIVKIFFLELLFRILLSIWAVYKNEKQINLMKKRAEGLKIDVMLDARQKTFEVSVLRKSPEELQNCPTLFGKFNENLIKTILDTGAEVTVAPRRIAKIFNGPLKAESGVILGIGGHEIRIIGKINGILDLLGTKIETNVLIIEDVPKSFHNYDLIVGLDVMKKVGRVVFNFANDEIEIGTTNSARFSNDSSASRCNEMSEYGQWLRDFICDDTRMKENSEYRYPLSMKELKLFIGLIESYKERIPNFIIRSALIRRAPIFNTIQEIEGNSCFRPFQAEEKLAYDNLIQHLQKIVAGESNSLQ